MEDRELSSLTQTESTVVGLLLGDAAKSLLDTGRLLNEQVIVSETHLSVTGSIGVGVGYRLEEAQECRRRLHVLGKAETGECLRVCEHGWSRYG